MPEAPTVTPATAKIAGDQGSVTISGTCRVPSTIAVTVDGQQPVSVPCVGGKWELTTSLTLGDHSVTADDGTIGGTDTDTITVKKLMDGEIVPED